MATLKLILDLFGATIIVPVVVFFLSLFLKVKLKDAFQGSLFMGIGLAAFNLVLSGLMGSLAPVVVEMAKNTGINLPTIDLGWPAAAMIVYANQIGLFYLVFGLAFDLFLFAIKWTDTFHPTDIWNYYQFVFWAAIVQLVTGSFFLGVLAAMFMNLVLLLIADWLAPSLQEYYGYDGVTDTTYASVNGAPFAVLIKWILMKLHLDQIQLNPETLKQKFGFWGEPVSMGLVIGFVVTFIAKINQLGSPEAWSIILKTAIITGAIMALYPAVSGLFVKGLIPISQTLNMRIRKGEIKRKKFNISMDSAVFFGEESTLTSGLLLIPIILAISIFQPGNNTMPLADLPAMPFMVIGIVAVMRGNIFSTVIAASVWYFFGNLANSDITPIFTEAAKLAGVEIPTAGAMVTGWSIGVSPLNWLVYKAFSAPVNIRIFTILAAFAVYLIVYFLFKKNQRAWQIAAGATPEFLDQKEAA
ncbi:PTS transporter subunit IIC [Desulfitobacterium sp. AusDCA]|uniref:PTS transporter subunit IIC n=1 Tax=Desulfitobacterium sp. AusDCA TaxID=3240383 RepID=UPI003DA6F0A1